MLMDFYNLMLVKIYTLCKYLPVYVYVVLGYGGIIRIFIYLLSFNFVLFSLWKKSVYIHTNVKKVFVDYIRVK